jgi:hypothetical protein
VGNILPHSPASLPRPFVIVGEGYGDVCFVDELLTFHNISNCSVGCPSRQTEKKKNGRNELDNYLAGIAIVRTNKDSTPLAGILIILDADTDPDGQFELAVDALTENGFPSPKNPYVVEEYDGFRVAAYLHPAKGRTGTLEHILLDAALKATPTFEKCLEAFADCTGAIPGATENQQAKMKLSALVGARCTENPWASDAMIWHSKGNPVPIQSDCFDALANFIKEFSRETTAKTVATPLTPS